jgi:hypothetical protein
MRKLLALTLVAGLLIAAGCGKPKETGKTGGEPSKKAEASKPEASKPEASKPAPPPPAAGSITLSDVAVDVEKEKDAKVKIKVARTDYKDEIKVTFDAKGAKGIALDPAEAVIPAEKDEVEVTVKAAKDAESGVVVVTATPKDEKVKPASGKLDVKVK